MPADSIDLRRISAVQLELHKPFLRTALISQIQLAGTASVLTVAVFHPSMDIQLASAAMAS